MFKCATCLVKSFAQLGQRSVDHVVKTEPLFVAFRNIHITSSDAKEVRQSEGSSKKVLVGSNKWSKADDGTATKFDLDSSGGSSVDIFPNPETPNLQFDGKLYQNLPIIHIRATPNNTIMLMSNWKGGIIAYNSCGLEGFKNARKGTNVAAQQVAATLSNRVVKQGFKNVRVLVEGIGPGRTASLKGLQLGGLNIISISDNTRVSWCPAKPRKRRRL